MDALCNNGPFKIFESYKTDGRMTIKGREALFKAGKNSAEIVLQSYRANGRIITKSSMHWGMFKAGKSSVCRGIRTGLLT